MNGFILRKIDEIRNDPAARFYGIALAFIHVLTAYAWLQPDMLTYLTARPNGICWPFFQNCLEWRLPDESLARLILLIYAAGAVLSAFLFWTRRVAAAFFALLAVNIVKFALQSLDYHFMGNYHYMPFVVTAAYLFIPRPLDLIRLLIVGFYLSAGFLKLNLEWFSGSALLRWPPVPMEMMVVAVSYVVLLELIFGWGLLSNQRWIRWGAYGQFLLFHLVSWYWVGYFYPLVMFSLLTVFPLAWRYEAHEESLVSRALSSQLPLSAYVFLLLYTISQTVPGWTAGDSSLTGEGRLYSLNMYDAQTKCYSTMIARYKNRSVELPLPPGEAVRVRCEPYLYYFRATQLCKALKSEPDFSDLDVHLISRKSSDPTFRPLLYIEDFCSSALTYSTWKKNAWILIDE